MPGTDFIIRTAADDLLELVKKNKRISVEDVAKQLKMPVDSVQALVDFLVEEKIFGIEYKFTTPYIYLYKEGIKSLKGKEKSLAEGLITKEQFYSRAKEKKVPYEQIEGMWRKYIQENIGAIKEEFLLKSRGKKIPEEKMQELWKKYLSYL